MDYKISKFYYSSNIGFQFFAVRERLSVIGYLFIVKSEPLIPRSLLFRSLVISKRSEESHKSLLPQSLKFLTSLPMTS